MQIKAVRNIGLAAVQGGQWDGQATRRHRRVNIKAETAKQTICK